MKKNSIKIMKCIFILAIAMMMILPNFSMATDKKRPTSGDKIQGTSTSTPDKGQSSGDKDQGTSTSTPNKGQSSGDKIENPSGSQQDVTDNPDYFKPGDITGDDADQITQKAGVIMNTISIIGVIVSVIVLVILGIKYMVGSVSEKAEYKKTMIPYLIGAFLILGTTVLLRIISAIVGGLNDSI